MSDTVPSSLPIARSSRRARRSPSRALARLLAVALVAFAAPLVPWTAAPSAAATVLPSIDGFKSIEAGQHHTCGIDDDRDLWCWGENEDGQLGNGTTTDAVLPTKVVTAGTPLAGKDIDEVSAGSGHTCAVTSDQVTACWGKNDLGQLGNGAGLPASDQTLPAAVTVVGTPLDGKAIGSISAGHIHTCATTTDGVAVCWGQGSNGSLGNGGSANRSTPTAVTTAGTPLAGKAIDTITAGYFHTCFVAVDGTLACSGSNFRGGLGLALATTSSLVPVSPATAGTVLAGKAINLVSAGRYNTCVVATDQTKACWGSNAQGELGNGTTSVSMPVTAITVAGTALAGRQITALTSGSEHHCARLDNGASACWGENGGRAVGNGTTTDALVATAPTTSGTALAGRTIDAVTAGQFHTCALLDDAKAACWGEGGAGSLGIGAAVDRPTATSVAMDPSVPGAPAVTSLSSTTSTVTVAWTAPANTGGAFITGYRVTPYVGGVAQTTLIVTTTNSVTSTQVGGLEPFTPYRFRVAAINVAGTGADSALSTQGILLQAPPIDLPGAGYVPITPCRIVDTRIAGGPFADRQIRDYEVAGSGSAFAAQGGKANGCGVPEEAEAVEASVTAVSPDDSGFFRAWPTGESMPNATFMNFDRGMDITNTGSIAIGLAGKGPQLRARNFGGRAHYVIDLQGYYLVPEDLTPPADPSTTRATLRDAVDEGQTGYVAITPCRVVDTRIAGGTLADREIRDYEISGKPMDIAAQGGQAQGCAIEGEVLAVEASITAVSPDDSGFFRAWPTGQSMPNATFMNFDRGMDITNTGSIAVNTTDPDDGQLRVRNFGGRAHYVIDIQGYWTEAVDGEETPNLGPGRSLSRYQPMTPCRIVDTRLAGGTYANRAIRDHAVAGAGEVFAEQGGKAGGCAVPEGSAAVEASITAVSPADSGFFRAWPTGRSMPNATFMNFDRGMDITNTGSIAIASGPGSSDEHLRSRNFGGRAHYVVDIQGYYPGSGRDD
jgi:alpha-tubulin suppressor-like RCC1 family protein